MMLEIHGLTVHYGVIRGLCDVDIKVDEGEIVTIIGANGAGKTSLMNSISGQIKPDAGEILFEGQKLPSASHLVLQRGIALVPEGRRIFGNLNVHENLMMGAYLRNKKAEIAKDLEEVFSIFPRLKERIGQSASTLSGGEQQMLAIGRAMMSKPRLLLLDEPSLGLAPLLVKEIFRTIKTLNQRGVTVLLVEQNAKQALLLAHRAYVFQTGKVIKEGKARDLLNDPEVKEAYLGGSTEKKRS
jgi:branched-chain amino acid transport system ATP-binding protein